MGKILEVLAKGKVPRNSIFNDRFVAECCETFHFHFRNIRHEFKWDDFLKLRRALNEIDATYTSSGEPKSHHYLELGRTLLNPENSSGELSVELCENIYKKYPTGWDSYFHEEDTFIHLHCRDLRMEMSNAEFIEFGRVVSRAYQKLNSIRYKTLSELFDLLDQERIIYAILRNWKDLPEKVEMGSHSDLDLIIHPDHVDQFDELVNSQFTTLLPYRVQRRVNILSSTGSESYILVDLRQPGDGYYPDELAYRMLERRVRFKNFWVLHPEDHLIGLAYHILFHKGYTAKDYPEQLKWLSAHLVRWPFNIFQGNDLTPYLKKILFESHVEFVSPTDLTVKPALPMLYPYTQMISNRYLWHHNGQAVFSRVYKIPSESGASEIVKQTSFKFSRQEFNILSRLDSQYFPRVWGFEDHGEYSLFHEEYIGGEVLSESQSIVSNWSFEQAKEFIGECIKLVKTLESFGIKHRDLRADNVLISSTKPVLLDFGWATTDEFPMDDPKGAGLGREARPPDGSPYDPYGLGMIIRLYIQPFFLEFNKLAELLLEGRDHRPIDWKRVDRLFNAIQAETPSSVERKFLFYCDTGRYRQAEEILSDLLDCEDDAVLFWKTYLHFSNKGEEFHDIIQIPEDIKKNENLLARLIRECLKKNSIVNSNLLALLFSDYLEICKNINPSLLIDLSKKFNEWSLIVGSEALKAFYRKGRKEKEWLNLQIGYLSQNDRMQELSDLLKDLKSGENDLTLHSLSRIAQMYFRAGDNERAEYFANLVLSQDPYFADCAKIMAIGHEMKNRIEEAVRWWRHYTSLTGGDEESRQKIIQLLFRRKSKKEQQASPMGSMDRVTHPKELLKNIEQHLNMNEASVALLYAKRLKDVLPENSEAEKIYRQVKEIADKSPAKKERQNIIIPKLTEAVYSKNIPIVKKQIEELLKGNPGSHRIIKEKYELILKDDKKGKASDEGEESRPEHLVSIIILAHNQLEFTKKCLDSIVRHTDEPFELVIVDNGSTDGTADYLKEIREGRVEVGGWRLTVAKNGEVGQVGSEKKRKKRINKASTGKGLACKRFKTIRNEGNLGFAAGNNQGLAEARGNYLLLMNNDVVVTPGWLGRMTGVAERKPEIGIVGPMSNYVSGPQWVEEAAYDHRSLAGLNQFAGEFGQIKKGQAKLFWRVVGFCMLIKRAVVDKIGGLDGRFGLGNFEDDDFSLRATLAGFESWIAEDCFIHHFGSQTFAGARIDYHKSLNKNWEVFKKKWNIPPEVAYGAPFDLAQIIKQGFSPAKHYYPISPEDFSISRGEEFFQSGDVEGARDIFNRVLKKDSEDVDALNNLGVISFQEGDMDQAITYFKRGLKQKPGHSELLENLGQCLIAKKAYEEAIQCYERALELKPDHSALLNSLGNCLIQAGDFLKAEEVYRRSYRLDSGQGKIEEILAGLEQLREIGVERSAAY